MTSLGLYVAPLAHAVVLSFDDEKSQIQALAPHPTGTAAEEWPRRDDDPTTTSGTGRPRCSRPLNVLTGEVIAPQHAGVTAIRSSSASSTRIEA